MKKLIGAIDAASLINCHRSHVLQLCRDKRLKGAQKIGNSWVIPVKSVEDYLATRDIRRVRRWKREAMADAGPGPQKN